MHHSLNRNSSFWGILICLVLLLGCKGDKIEDIELIPDLTSSSRVGSCDLVISGRVMDTKNLQPIKGAAIHSTLFSAKTDQDGNFRVELAISVIDDPAFITISKSGYLSQTVPIFYDAVLGLNDCPDITNIDWKIGLSAKQECVRVGKDEGAWYKIMDTVASEIVNEFGVLDTIYSANLYEVDVRRKSLEEYANLCISPDNSFAYGPGILVNHNLFRVASFVIEDGDNPENELNFLKAVEILFINANPDDYPRGKKLPVLDLDQLTIDAIGSAFVFSNTKIRLNFKRSGNIFIGNDPDFLKLCLELLEALREKDKEAIRPIIERIINNPERTTRIGDRELKVGAIVKEEIFSNCDCSQPNQGVYDIDYDGTEILNINFPAGTSNAIQTQAIIKLRTLLGDSGKSSLQANLKVNLDKCTQATVISRPIFECVSGVIDGFSFTYEAIEKLETIINKDSCPTDTGCHQGCTG